MLHFQPFIQIRHNCAVIYDVPTERRKQSAASMAAASARLAANKAYSGKVTENSKKRILAAVDVLLQKSVTRRIYNPVKGGEHDFRIGFWTLTVADQEKHTAREAYDTCLKPFLRTMRTTWKAEDYIWKAELTKRGQIHYHITANQFVHLENIRGTWNKLQKKAGWLDSFARRHKHFNPNSIDVHSVWKVKNLGGYLAKYVAKVESEKDATIGKVWDCSKSLKVKRYTTELTCEMIEKIEEASELGFCEIVKLDNCTIIRTENPASILDDARRQELANIFPIWHTKLNLP